MKNYVEAALAVALMLGAGQIGPAEAAVTKKLVQSGIETSGPKPAWVSSDQDTYLQNGKTYQRVVLDDQRDLGLGLERAKYQAMANIRTSIMTDVAAAFDMTETVTSNDVDSDNAGNDDGSHIQTQMASIAKGLHLPGLTQEASYWEKRPVRTAQGELRSAYRIWVLVSMPERYRKKAQTEATSELQRLHGQPTAQERVRGVLDEEIERMKEEN